LFPLSKIGNRFLQCQALEPWEWRLLVDFAVLLPLIWLGLRLLSFKRVSRFAQREIQTTRVPALPCGFQAYDYGQRCAELTAIAARHGIYRANCLHQALVLCRVLRRNGLSAQLRVGVKPEVRPFEAHAWVELDGQVLGPSLDEYFPFSRLGQAGEPKAIN
jgi:hypothetical protein